MGYNPKRPGRRSLHPLIAVAAGTRLCVSYHFRAGNTVTATNWSEAMEDTQRWLGAREVTLNRGDLGLGQQKVLAWHEEPPGGGRPRPRYLFKLKLTRNVRRAIALVPAEAWQGGAAQRGVLQVAEVRLRLEGWSTERRVVVGRRLLGTISAEQAGTFWAQHKHEFEAYVTNLEEKEVTAWQVVDLYRPRADAENVFDELKNQWGFDGFCAQKKEVTALAARLGLVVYNLWHLFLRLLEPARHVETRTGRRWFLLIAGRLTKSGRGLHFSIASSGEWWQQLKAGYERVCRWLEATAPQLHPAAGGKVDFAFLKPAPS